MRQSKTTLEVVLVLLLIGTLCVSANAMFISGGSFPDYKPISVQPWEIDDLSLKDVLEPEMEVSRHHSYWDIGDYWYWLLLDDYYGWYWISVHELRAIGEFTEVWVQVNMAWPGRPTPIITDEQVQYILEEFESNIYPTDAEYFLEPDFHDGSYAVLDDILGLPGAYEEETGRQVIIVQNIRDLNFYDPTYPYYIIGYYSGTVESYIDRNVIHIDCYDWENRLGPRVARPYTMESTVAHEYQHLLHADHVPGDDSFMNEAFSMYSEILCGYGVSWGHVNHYLYAPDNSLAKWGDQGGINILADYGAAALWIMYLSEQMGTPEEPFVTRYMTAGIGGAWGVDAALAYYGIPKTFDDLYSEWNLANSIGLMKNAPYGYETLNLNPKSNKDVIPFNYLEHHSHFPTSLRGSDFGSTITIYGYDTGVVDLAPYSSDFILFNDWADDAILYFDGDDPPALPYGWEMVDGMWYSGATNMFNTLIATEVSVPNNTPELEITTYWDIEDYWDFGFVQVSTDDGLTWTSLENEYTTYVHDPSAYWQIVANLPGLTSWSGFLDPDGWITMSFDLTDYAGMDVMLGFRYMTDWGTLFEGWYIESVEVDGTVIPLDSFEKIIEYPSSYFTVTVVYLDGDIEGGSELSIGEFKGLEVLNIDHTDETGEIFVDGSLSDHVLVIVSNPTSDSNIWISVVADYEITIEKA